MVHIKYFVVTLVLFIVACAVITQYMHARMKEHMQEVKCPIPNAPFKDKKFFSDDTCMAHDTLECRDVLKKLKIEPSAKGLTKEDLNAALDVISNNTYMNVSDSDNTLYSTNECVIPESERTKMGFQNCKVGDMQLGSNPEDMEVLWTYKDGCVISESQLRNNIGDVLTQIDTSSKERKKQIQANINTSVKELTDETGGLVTSFNNNTRDAKNLKSQAETIRKEKADADSRTRSSAKIQSNFESKTTSTSKDADNEQTKYNNMKKDCVVSWNVGSCQGSCGTGYQSVTPSYQQPQNGGNACPKHDSYTQSCDTGRACEWPVGWHVWSHTIRPWSETGQCLDISGWGGHNGANFISWWCHGGANQRFERHGNTFRPRHIPWRNKCMDVRWFGNGSPIEQWDCHNHSWQNWQYYNDNTLRPNSHTGMCMTYNGAMQNMTLNHCNGSWNQKWHAW